MGPRAAVSGGGVSISAVCFSSPVANDRVQVTYKGSAPFASLLAQELKEAGLSVSYEPPTEQRDLESVIELARITFEVIGDGSIVWSVVRTFKSRFPRAEIEAPPAPELTLEERLARVDDLLERGVITQQEHDRQRARIQDESL
jgi:hypothetical protein